MQTIWSDASIPPSEWKYRNLKRIVLPTIDLLFVLGGILGALHGIPAISDVFPGWPATVGGIAFAFVGAVCLVGVAIPKLWQVEVWGKSIILGMIVGYIIALATASIITRTSAAYVLSLAGIALTIVVWRLSLLAAEARERRGL